jgi:hypothetical protein
MWYSGGNFFRWRICYATSSNGSVWVKADSLNPVLDWGHTNEWDDYGVGFCSVLFDSLDEEFKMWYSGFDDFWSTRIGYATAPIDSPTSIEDYDKSYITEDFSLSQNYPNPFNPSTKIKYSVPQSSQVQIKVFDVLGNEIETLVNQEKPAGTYEITWYAEALPSGIYFYQLKVYPANGGASSFVETKKMILLR